jgi:polysaccharide biosynthesis/export protein
MKMLQHWRGNKTRSAFGAILFWSIVSIDSTFAQIPILQNSDTDTSNNRSIEYNQVEGETRNQIPRDNNFNNNFDNSTNSTTVPTNTNYTLGAGDRLRFDLFQAEDYSGEYNVLADGTLNLPLIGSVLVQDKTIAEVSQIISQKYAKFYKRPIVTLSVLQPRALQIAVAGEVINPGSYNITFEDKTSQKFPSVTEMIKNAGGTTNSADIGRVEVRRVYQGTTKVFTVNLWELVQEGNIQQDIALRDGDTIFIPTNETADEGQIRQLANANFGIQSDRVINVAIVGEVYRPGSYQVRNDVNNDNNTNNNNNNGTNLKLQPPKLSQALSLAGGIKPLADVRKVEVRRLNRNGKEQVIEIDLWELVSSGDIGQDIILQDGDTIVIPQAVALNPEESEQLAAANFSPAAIKVNVVGEVKEPGLIEVPPNTPLNQAILAAGGFNDSRADSSEVELVRLNPNGTVTKRTIQVDLAGNPNDETNPIIYNNDAIVVKRSSGAEFGDVLGTILSPITPILTIFGLF